jgi:hypothetical protein
MPSGWPALDAGGRGNLEKRLRYSPRIGLSYSVDFPLTSCIKQLTARMLDLLVAASLTTPEQRGAPHQMDGTNNNPENFKSRRMSFFGYSTLTTHGPVTTTSLLDT